MLFLLLALSCAHTDVVEAPTTMGEGACRRAVRRHGETRRSRVFWLQPPDGDVVLFDCYGWTLSVGADDLTSALRGGLVGIGDSWTLDLLEALETVEGSALAEDTFLRMEEALSRLASSSIRWDYGHTEPMASVWKLLEEGRVGVEVGGARPSMLVVQRWRIDEVDDSAKGVRFFLPDCSDYQQVVLEEEFKDYDWGWE